MEIIQVNGIKFTCTVSRHNFVRQHQRTPGSNITKFVILCGHKDTNRFKDLLLSESYELSRISFQKKRVSETCHINVKFRFLKTDNSQQSCYDKKKFRNSERTEEEYLQDRTYTIPQTDLSQLTQLLKYLFQKSCCENPGQHRSVTFTEAYCTALPVSIHERQIHAVTGKTENISLHKQG